MRILCPSCGLPKDAEAHCHNCGCPGETERRSTTDARHDEVYDLACECGAGILASYLFDTEAAQGCNGIWAVAHTAGGDDFHEDAQRRITSLMHGTLPPGIRPHNETTEAWLDQLWNY